MLNSGEKRWDTAWKSASELVVPIFVATLTIILAFLPMIMLSGPVGEFIESLPYTVTISWASSFIVAMVLTPLLSYTFIQKGLHDANKKEKLLDKMQKVYNRALAWCIQHPYITLLGSLIPVLFSTWIYFYGIKQKFLLTAERNQFVVELWMPTGTRLEKTEASIQKIEKLLENDERIVNFTTFVGGAAPRFYYNFSPEFPVSNYSQIIINTTSTQTTNQLAKELPSKVKEADPEGSPQVKLMQQGKPLNAPVEVQIWGDDIAQLKSIGEEVKNIIRTKKGYLHLRDNYKKDYLGMDIRLKPEAARLGFTTEIISKSVYAGFSGAPVSTLREGSKNIPIQFRLNEGERQTVQDLNQMYLSSPVTGAQVPLSQIAELVPVWKTGVVKYRNGWRVLTVQCSPTDDILPSELLKAIRPEIEAIPLPTGYKIDYAGEFANQVETFSEMVIALTVSMLLIFLVILFQFRNLKEAAIIMLTIPLSLFGALLGLLITGNNFGFTAFVGIISLSGIVVRNAIILIDHIHELVHVQGMTLSQATIENGHRRLRPIFLTAMAAAIGVLPMIITGSPMWSPLASVIAMGVIWSMIIALLTVPVFYLLWVVPKNERNS